MATFFLLGDLGYGLGSYFLGAFASVSNYQMMYIASVVVAFLAIVIYWINYHLKERLAH